MIEGIIAGRQIVFVSTNPETLSTEAKRNVRIAASKLGVKPYRIERLEVALKDSDLSSRILVLTDDDWMGAGSCCESCGMQPMRDYVPLWFILILNNDLVNYNSLVKLDDIRECVRFLKGYRKLACIFGNCQTGPLRELIASDQGFSQDYLLLKMPYVQDTSSEIRENGFDKELLKALSLLMIMHIESTNKFSEKLATDYIRNQLSKECKVVIIPNCYFTAYFPQATCRKIKNVPTILAPTGKLLFYNDTCLDECIANRNEAIEHPTFEETTKNLEKTISEMTSRESKCDVVISDYILENYKKRRLFHSRSHPTDEVLKEVAVRILRHLGYTPKIVDKPILQLDHDKEFIYPEVYDYLGLMFPNIDTYINSAVSKEPTDESLYLDIARFFKDSEYVTRSVRWVSRPLHKSLNLSANLISVAESKVSITSPLLMMSDVCVQMSFALVASESVPIGTTIATIPECTSPPQRLITIGMSVSGAIAKIIVEPTGKITVGPIPEEEYIIVNAMWLY